jgi:hypothetical protein
VRSPGREQIMVSGTGCCGATVVFKPGPAYRCCPLTRWTQRTRKQLYPSQYVPFMGFLWSSPLQRNDRPLTVLADFPLEASEEAGHDQFVVAPDQPVAEIITMGLDRISARVICMPFRARRRASCWGCNSTRCISSTRTAIIRSGSGNRSWGDFIVSARRLLNWVCWPSSSVCK